MMLQVTANVACIDKNTEKRRKNVCAIVSVHERDWLVLYKQSENKAFMVRVWAL